MAFLLWRLPSVHQQVNRSLAFFLTLASCLIIGRLAFFRTGSPTDVPLAMLADTAIFLFGPLLYQYFRRLSQNPKYILKWYHGLPAFFHLLLIVFFNSLGYSMFIQMNNTDTIWYWYGTMEGLGLVLNLGYWIASVISVRAAYRNKSLLVFNSLRSQRWLWLMLSLLGLGLATWLVSFIAGWGFKYWMNFVSYHVIWLCLAGFTYLMGISMLFQPQLYHSLQYAIAQRMAPKRERLNESQRDQLASQLNQLMTEKELFRQGDLTQKALAENLGTSVHNLSWMLNQHYQKTFSEYINHLRLQAFLSKVAAGEHHQKTLLALALDAGFSSKSTFNRVFKEQYQCSPSEYIAQLAA